MAASWPIQFTKGSRPGVKRCQQSTEDTTPKKKDRTQYEKDLRPARSFNEKWKEGREWLCFDGDTRSMTCSYCISFSSSTSVVKCSNNLKNKLLFVSGCSNFRYSAVTDHEKSKIHQETTIMYLASKNPTITPAYKSLLSLKESTRKQLENKFRNIHALVKYNRPLSDFSWLNRLDASKGLDVGETYNNRKAGTLFLENIGQIEREKLISVIENVKFFSLTMDGSTDDGSVEQETIFIRFCNKGQVSTKFVCIGEPASTGSSDLYDFVIEQLKVAELFDKMDKFIGFGSDGASNMTGRRTGLISRLKEDYTIVGVHCLAHRLELSFRDAIKKNAMYDKLLTLLLGIYYFYKRSPLQRKTLKSSFKVGKLLILTLTSIAGTTHRDHYPLSCVVGIIILYLIRN